MAVARDIGFGSIAEAIDCLLSPCGMGLCGGSTAEEPSEIEADQEQHEVDRAARSAELGRLDGAGPYQRDRELCQIEIELHSAADEERAGEEFAVLAVSHGDVDRRQPDDDDRYNEIGKHGLAPDLTLGLALATRLFFCIFGICRICQIVRPSPGSASWRMWPGCSRPGAFRPPPRGSTATSCSALAPSASMRSPRTSGSARAAPAWLRGCSRAIRWRAATARREPSARFTP